MGWRFSRRIGIVSGVRLNLGKSGVSTPVGGRGVWVTYGRGRRRVTAGVPGTGISHTKETRTSSAPAVLVPNRRYSGTAVIVGVALVLAAVVMVRWHGW